MENEDTVQPKILVVDDNEQVRESLETALTANLFEVTTAANVSEALHLIDTKPFDVLLCDLQMPGAGDGFIVVGAMRSKHPKAVTLLLTGYPALGEAMKAIRRQADEVLVKPIALSKLVSLINERLKKRALQEASRKERVTSILQRYSSATITLWLSKVESDGELTSVLLNREQRMGQLAKLIEELVHRLRVPQVLGTKAVSEAAFQHGKTRRSQGYSITMIIEEFRILQVSIFETLQTNLNSVDFSSVLIDVMAIADECDSQLKQTIISFSGRTAKVTA